MKKAVWVCVILGCMVLFVSTAGADKAEKCEELARKGLEMFKIRGVDAALKAVNSESVLTDRELYVFAVNMENTVLGHPYKPSLIGTNMNDVPDSHGKYFAREFRSVALEKGSGWVEYWWLRPGEKKPRFKRAYIRRVPGEDIYLGIGYYPEAEGKPSR